MNRILIILFSLLLMGCLKDAPDSVQEENKKRGDISPPIFGAVTPSEYVDEESNELVNFGLRQQNLQTATKEIVFKKNVTSWSMPNSPLTFVTEALQKNTYPYYVVTLSDIDTPLSQISLQYAFSIEEEKLSEADFHDAQPYPMGFGNQWIVVICEETVGEKLKNFIGPKSFTLHLKAIDGGANVSTRKEHFVVHNLLPNLKLVQYPDYMDASQYKLRQHSVFWGDDQDHYLEMLRDDRPFPEELVFTRVLLENKTKNGMYVKINFDGKVEYKYEKWFWPNNWTTKDEPLAMSLSLEKRRDDAPVTLDIQEWRGNGSLSSAVLAHVRGHRRVYYVPPQDPSRGELGRTGLMIFFKTDFNFQTRIREVRHFTSLNTNERHVDYLKLSGHLSFLSAPDNLSNDYYAIEDNWYRHQGEFSLPLKLVSQ